LGQYDGCRNLHGAWISGLDEGIWQGFVEESEMRNIGGTARGRAEGKQRKGRVLLNNGL
jgi:hypothetical protein